MTALELLTCTLEFWFVYDFCCITTLVSMPGPAPLNTFIMEWGVMALACRCLNLEEFLTWLASAIERGGECCWSYAVMAKVESHQYPWWSRTPPRVIVLLCTQEHPNWQLLEGLCNRAAVG